jgi:hypothetical protein
MPAVAQLTADLLPPESPHRDAAHGRNTPPNDARRGDRRALPVPAVTGPKPGGEAGGRSATRPLPDERTVTLIHRYGRPDHRGWTLSATDIGYRLSAWHGIAISRADLDAALTCVPGRRYG